MTKPAKTLAFALALALSLAGGAASASGYQFPTGASTTVVMSSDVVGLPRGKGP